MEEDREKMTDASGQNKKMPDGVIERKFFPGIKNNPQGVGQAARYQPYDAAGGKGLSKRFDGKNDNPAHHDLGDWG